MLRPLLVISVAFLIAVPSAFADKKQMMEDYKDLKYSSANYQPFGTVCEQVAKLRLEERFDDELFEVVTGIGYFHRGGRQIGELDVVVLRKSDQEAVMIAEVKCWNNLASAKKKAWRQLNRFRDNFDRNTPVTMHLMDDHKIEFTWEQFDESPEYIIISQNGGL